MFSSLAEGITVIKNYLRAEDTMSTLNAFRALGVSIEDGAEIKVRGSGLHGLKEPQGIIDCGNSGTTMRLLTGILSGNPFMSVLSGDSSLNKRPMARVINPMRDMGAAIMARAGDKYPPIAIKGGSLKPIKYKMPMSSAQVKSAILLAGLYADGATEITEPVKSRDHTERMLPAFGARLAVEGLKVTVQGGAQLKSTGAICVPNDFSSAAFFIAAALIVKGSEVIIRDVGINPTRTGFLDVIKKMGADIKIENRRDVSGEQVADIICSHSILKSVDVGRETVASMIDEFPIFCILAAVADGASAIRGAEELRVKESDRISAMAKGLKGMGVSVEEHPDGMTIKGTDNLRGTSIDTFKDHRIAMSFAVASLVADGAVKIRDAESVDISFPGFFDNLGRLRG